MLALGIVAAVPSLSVPPPPVIHARYGPLTQCLNGYAITASRAEAILAMDGGATLASDVRSLNISVDRGDPYRARYQATEVDTPNLGRIMRYQHTLGGSDPYVETFYMLPALEGYSAALVHARGFDGSEQDLATLARVSRVDQSRTSCGDFAAPDYAGENPEARWWSAAVFWGERLHCMNGIAFHVGDGEAIQSQWRGFTIYDEPVSRLWSEGQWLVVHGPQTVLSISGQFASTYQAEIVDWGGRPNLLLHPRGRGTGRNAPHDSYLYWLRIDFPAGAEAQARALGARFEFVPTGDPRCGRSN